MSEGHVMTTLPQYRCHKKVWALKIAKIEPREDGAGAIITPEEKGYAPFPVQHGYMVKHSPQVGGYWVQYDDGYQSYSPAKAFEDGYSLIDFDPGPEFRVVEGNEGCEQCGNGKTWRVVRPNGTMEPGECSSQQEAEGAAHALQVAYDAGRDVGLDTAFKRSLNTGTWSGADYELASKTHEAAETITRRLAENVVKMVYFRYLSGNSQLDTPEKEIVDDVVALAMGEKDCELLGINSEGECENEFVEQQIFGLLRLPKPAELVPFFDFLQPADGPVVEGMEEAEVVYAKDQPPYRPLRTLPSNGPERKVLSRWALRPDQREAVARGADVYLELMTFGHPLQPIRMGIGYKPNPAFIMNLMWPDQSSTGQATESDQK